MEQDEAGPYQTKLPGGKPARYPHKYLRAGTAKILLLTLLAAMLPACTATRMFPAEPHGRAAPAGAIPSSYLWDSDADLASGTFYNTRVVSGTGRVTLAQTPVWSPSVRVDDAPSGKQFSPSLAVGPDGTLYAAWHDSRNGDDADIYFARSRDGGATWSPNVRVDDAPSASQLLPSLVVGPDGTLYAAWKDTRNRHTDVYFASSTDGGVTWSANVRIDDALSEVPSLAEWGKPSLAVGPDGTLYAAWDDDRNGNLDQDIYFARSTDGGATWSASVRVDDALSGDQGAPSLAVGPDGTLYVVWHDFRNNTFDIYSTRSRDGGATWSVNVRVDDAPSGDQWFPYLAVGPDGTLYAAWAEDRDGNWDEDIYFARSRDGGATWSTNVRVDDAPSGDQWYPFLAGGPDGTLYAAWQDGRINNDGIYSACSRDGGDTWSASVRVDDAPSGDQWYPSLAVGPDGTLYAAWADSRTCNYDLFRIRNDAFRDCNRDIYAAQYSERYGRYTAAPVDAGAHVVWGTLAYTATVPAGTGITLTVRVGNSPMPDARWSTWVTLGGSPADLSALPPARYFQWEAALTTPVSTTTPAIEAVHLTWGAVNCTNVSGILSSNTTWSAANSPYCVTGNVLVDAGVTLTVEPGVTVYISDARSIQVQGTLVALGTEAQPIRLTSWHPQGQSEDWGGITFGDTAVGATFDAQGNYLGGSAFRYVTVEYAGYGSQGYAIDAPNTALYLDHCTVRYNGAGGARVGGSSSRILNNLFSANSGGGVHNSGSDVTISGNVFSGNAFSGGLAPFGGGVYNSGFNVTISGNVFSGNVFPSDLASYGGGVYNAGSNVIVRGNVFSANSAHYGGAIWWSGSGGILYNTIVGNTSSLGRGGVYLDSGFPVIRLNALVGNGDYALYNNNGGTTHVDARYNWWGTTDDGTIQGLICNWFDNGNKTIVDYAPYLTTLTADLSAPSK